MKQNQKDKIALIGSGILSKELAIRAKQLKIETHCFSFNDKDIACTYVDFFHKVDIFNIDKIVSICEKNNISGIIATTELTILPAAQIADKLGLLGNKIKVAEEITNKFITREKVKNVKDLNQPRYILYSDGDFPTDIIFPVIVKPIAAGGKRGINVAYNQLDMEEAIKNALTFSKVKGVLIEEFLNGGNEYSVETLSYKGIHYVTQITEKVTSGPPHCNELAHHQPANISDKLKEKIKQVISDMLDAVGVTNGPSHTEIKIINNESIYLIEINDRPGGDHITYPLTELSTGYPYLSGIIYGALGKLEGKEPLHLEKYYAGIYFVTDKSPQFKPIFDVCDNYPWLYKKHIVDDNNVSTIQFNDEEGLNYFIYYSKTYNPITFIESYKVK